MEAIKCPSCGNPDIQKISITEYVCKSCNTHSKLSNDSTQLVILTGYPCPECGSSNESGIKFCGNCGAKLTKFCRACNSEIQVDKKFCTNCGKSDFSPSISYRVVIHPVPEKMSTRVETIKIIRIFCNLGLVAAKNLSDNGGILASNLSYDKAVELKEKFNKMEKLGVKVEIKS